MLQPYAPSTSTSVNQLIDSTALLEETTLYTTSKEQDLYESLAELYSIITSLNFLEKSYLRDSLHEDNRDELYTNSCQRLINQFNAILKNESVKEHFQNLNHFFAEYDIDYHLAKSRLQIGIPATMEAAVRNPNASQTDIMSSGVSTNSSRTNLGESMVGKVQPQSTGSNTRLVAEATGNFITLMDAIKLNYRTKDQLHPLLSELVTNTNKVLKNGEFDGRSKLIQWLIKLNALEFHQKLAEDDAKEFLFDVDLAYKGFYSCLN